MVAILFIFYFAYERKKRGQAFQEKSLIIFLLFDLYFQTSSTVMEQKIIKNGKEIGCQTQIVGI